MADIIENGTEAFHKHLITLPTEVSKREEISLVTSQFLSFKEFSEKLNVLSREIAHMFKKNTIESLQIYINNNFKKEVFNAEKINLWMADLVNDNNFFLFYCIKIFLKDNICALILLFL